MTNRTLSSRTRRWAALVSAVCWGLPLAAQPYGEADRGQPGDAGIQEYLRRESERLEADFLGDIHTAEAWRAARPRFHQEYLDMLGLWPMPGRSPLQPTVTRTLERGDYAIEMVHFQSRPGLYVTANLYRPARVAPGQRLPGILYVCGHAHRGRDGNKTAYQSHGIWLGRHGYLCLMVDTLQLGELAGIHHGLYREGRWWWLSRGYAPAGVECWNGVRGLDYLASRPDVDPDRLGVTGISGGGAATFWIAAADERAKVAIPVSGMADLRSYVGNRVINGHCDCMFLYNTFQWPWTRIAALVAPRPLLFVNSDADAIFPMDANDRVINRLERVYSLFGTGDVVDSLVSIGGHAYRQDIRQGAYRFLNTHFKNDPRRVLDSEIDLVTVGNPEVHPIPPEQLRVFPRDEDIPKDAINARADQEFVPQARVAVPQPGAFAAWKADLLTRLRRLTFHHFPERLPPAQAAGADGPELTRLATEPAIVVRLRTVRAPAKPQRALLIVSATDVAAAPPVWLTPLLRDADALYTCEPRGLGASRWTTKNPPNYVERSHYLLGRTIDSGRVWDIVATARFLRQRHGEDVQVYLAGEGAPAVLAAFAALLEPEVAGLMLSQAPGTFMDATAPALLNVLRVCDIPDAFGMLAPRPLTLVGDAPAWSQKVAAVYQAADAAKQLEFRK